jgi:hypothetical protein
VEDGMQKDTGRIEELANLARALDSGRENPKDWVEIKEETANFLQSRLNRAERQKLMHLLRNREKLTLQDMRTAVAEMRG